MSSDFAAVRDTLSHFNSILTKKTARAPDKISKAKELIHSDTELSHDYNLLRANTEVLKKDWQKIDTSASYSIALLVLFEHEIKDISSPHLENLLVYLMKNESPLAKEVMQVLEERENFSIKQFPLERLKELSVSNIFKLLRLCEKKTDIKGVEWILANVMNFTDNNIKHIMTHNANKQEGIVSRLTSFLKERAKEPQNFKPLSLLDEMTAKNPTEAQQKIARIMSSPTRNVLLKNIFQYENLLHCFLTHPELESFVQSESFDWKPVLSAFLRSKNPEDYINFFMAMERKLENNPLTENDNKLYTDFRKIFLIKNTNKLSSTQIEWFKKQSYIDDVNQYIDGLSKNMHVDGKNRKKIEKIIRKAIEFNDLNTFKSILYNPSLNFTGKDIRSLLFNCLRQKGKQEFVSILLDSKSFDKFCFNGILHDLIRAFITPTMDSLRNYQYIPMLFNYACKKMDLDILSHLSDGNYPGLFNFLSPNMSPGQFENLRNLPLSEFKQAINEMPLSSVHILLGRFGYNGITNERMDCIMERLNPTLQQYTNMMRHYQRNHPAVSYFLMKIQDPETRIKILRHVNSLGSLFYGF